jgi:hypothetical protein
MKQNLKKTEHVWWSDCFLFICLFLCICVCSESRTSGLSLRSLFSPTRSIGVSGQALLTSGTHYYIQNRKNSSEDSFHSNYKVLLYVLSCWKQWNILRPSLWRSENFRERRWRSTQERHQFLDNSKVEVDCIRRNLSSSVWKRRGMWIPKNVLNKTL